MNKIIKGFLIALGTLSVGLGLLGMLLPVLPTTPFLLLAAFCYARSSERFYHWLMTNRLFGDVIRRYREGRGMTLKHKVVTLVLEWASIGYAAWFVVRPWWGKGLMVAIAVGVTIHIVRINTYREGVDKTSREEALSK